MEVLGLAVFAMCVALSVLGEVRAGCDAKSMRPLINRYTLGCALAILGLGLRLSVCPIVPDSPLLGIMLFSCFDSLCLFVVGIYVLFRGGELLYDLLGKGPDYPPRIDLKKRAGKPLGTLLSLACVLGLLFGIRAVPYVFVWVLVTFF